MLLSAVVLFSCRGTPQTLIVQGLVLIRSPESSPLDTQYPNGLTVNIYDADGHQLAVGVTDENGRFSVELTGIKPGEELHFDTSVILEGIRTQQSVYAKAPIPPEGEWIIPAIAFLDHSKNKLFPSDAGWTDTEGKVLILDEAGQFSEVSARAFDPELERAFFPGPFRNSEGTGLVSSAFLHIVAKDEAGMQVKALSSPITIYFDVPYTHRYYLKDVIPGNGSYDVPMYLYDEETAIWMRRGTGVLVDEYKNPLPEEAERQVRSDPHFGKVYVKFQADHLSVWNLDHELPPCSSK